MVITSSKHWKELAGEAVSGFRWLDSHGVFWNCGLLWVGFDALVFRWRDGSHYPINLPCVRAKR